MCDLASYERADQRMSDLIAFLNARLDEDEAAAQAATPGPWSVAKAKRAEYDELAILSDGEELVGAGYEGGGVWSPPDAAHIARHDPARVLREVAAKRAIIARYEDALSGWPPPGGPAPDLITLGLAFAIRALCSAYSAHPDYQQGWALDGGGDAADLR